MVLEVIWQNYPLERVLEERFRITSGFRSGQRDIIEQLIQGKRVLAIQPTGWGKSLCYQMASLYCPHLTIVFSPLKALMRDQCQRCNNSYAIASAIVSSDFTEQENMTTLERAKAGKLKLLFIAPERLNNAMWQRYVAAMRIGMVVIDEAHCISIWGHDFRPHYRWMVQLLNALPKNTPVLALTATVNERVEADILRQIGNAQIIRGAMHRPNLYLHVVRLYGDWEKLCYLEAVLSGRSDTGIVCTATQSSAEMVAAFLCARGIKAQYYHAGRDDDICQCIEQQFMANHYRIMCSTIALGMGIDKPDIRFVIHYHMSASPIHYYQEMGRAGRDGDAAWCILLYDPADVVIHEHLIHNDRPKEKYYGLVLSLLYNNASGLNEHNILMTTGLSRNAVRTIVADLEDQHFITYNPVARTYTASMIIRHESKDGLHPHIDFTAYEAVQLQKLQELQDMHSYARTEQCYMCYVTAYIGDQNTYRCGVCGNCRRENFPLVKPSERIQASVSYFLEEEYLPPIESCNIENKRVHEGGWALSYHGITRIGKLVSLSKYEHGGPFALSLVLRAVEIVRSRYPIQALQGVVSVPPTSGNMLVEQFARQVAQLLGLEYLPLLGKIRSTRRQKSLTNRVQKAENVKGAFGIQSPERIAGRVLLVIDDIYDSGYTLREVGKTLMQARARAVYPFTITRTTHSDDQ